MKKIITPLIIAGLLSALNSFAQIPDPSFEAWTGSDLTNWETANALITGLVTKSSNAHLGTSGAQINVKNFFGIKFPGMLKSNKPDDNFPVTSNPIALHGWYILNSDSGDALDVITYALDSSTSSIGAVGTFTISTSTSVYKEFIANYNYTSTSFAADLVSITITLSNPAGGGYPLSLSSNVIIDDLSFGIAMSVNENNAATDVVLENAYPNPAQEYTHIIYSLPKVASVKMDLFDITGRKVMNAINEPNQSPGRYKAVIDTQSLSKGIYFYTLTVDGVSQTKKLIVVD